MVEIPDHLHTRLLRNLQTKRGIVAPWQTVSRRLHAKLAHSRIMLIHAGVRQMAGGDQQVVTIPAEKATFESGEKE